MKALIPTFEEAQHITREAAGAWCNEGHWVFSPLDKEVVRSNFYCSNHLKNFEKRKEDRV